MYKIKVRLQILELFLNKGNNPNYFTQSNLF